MFDFEVNKKAKFDGVDAVSRVQTEGLRAHLAYARKHSPAYSKILEDINPQEMTLADLRHLPLTEKQDIEKDPLSFLAVSRDRIADIVLSSGTTGRALQFMYTAKDLQRLAYNEEQAFAGCGITEKDTALLTCTMDRCFIAGLAYFLGMRQRGAAVIRNGHGAIESHADVIRQMHPTVIVGVPTFLKKLAHKMNTAGGAAAASSVEKIICIGEPLRGAGYEMLGIGRELEDLWQAKVFSTYASTETITTFCECTAQRGGHLIPELAVLEILDESGKPVPAGTPGEVVMTPLAVEGMPLVRYRTGDISFVDESPCACGRVTPRLGPVLGRKKQLMKVKGTSLYPQAVFAALEEITAVKNYYAEVFSQGELSDRLVVHVSLNDESVSLEELEETMTVKLRIKPEIVIEDESLVQKKVFVKSSRKPVRFFDRR